MAMSLSLIYTICVKFQTNIKFFVSLNRNFAKILYGNFRKISANET